MTGAPGSTTQTAGPVDRLIVSAERISHIKTRLQVKEGDRVRLGSVLFTDKRNPDMRFLSPGAGVIETIEYGPRRVIRAIVIQLDRTEEQESFKSLAPGQTPESLSRSELVQRLTEGGIWPFIRSLPFRDIADPGIVPPAIIVPLDCLDPFHPPPAFYLEGAEDDFYTGLLALSLLAPIVNVVGNGQDPPPMPEKTQRVVTHRLNGPYPADDPGVFIYHTRADAQDNASWYIHGADVVLLGKFLTTGRFPVQRVVTVSAPGVISHVHTRIGAPITSLAPAVENLLDYRVIAGGVFRGQAVSPGAGVNYYETAITVLPEGNKPEFVGFLRPGFRKPSHWRAFLSAFNPGPFDRDTGLHGEERACINCGACAEVCPVDILPQFTMKSLVAGEIEEALAHGLLDCVECGLCSYVCPSKVELCEQLRSARKTFYKEQAAS